jgi:hypothetical protein
MLLNQNTGYNPLRYSIESYEPDEDKKQNQVIINNPYQPKNYHIVNNIKTNHVPNYLIPNALNGQRLINMSNFQNFANFKNPSRPPHIVNAPNLKLINKTIYNNIPNYAINRNPYQFSNGKNINYSQIVYPRPQITQPIIKNSNSSFMTPIKNPKYISKTPLNNTKIMYPFNMSKQVNIITQNNHNINMNRNIMPYTMKQLPTNVVRQNTVNLNKNVYPIHRIISRRKY